MFLEDVQNDDELVELGQLMVLMVVVPLLYVLFKYFVNERVGTILLSALLAHSAWHWMLDRGNQLSEYQFQMPIFDGVFFASLMRWGMMFIIIGGVLWLMYEVFRRFAMVEAISSYGTRRETKAGN